MEEFEPSSKLGIGNVGVRAKLLTLGIGNGRVLAKFEAWNRKWRSSNKVRGLESEMEVFTPCLRLGIGNGGVQAMFRPLGLGMEEFEPISRL